MVPGVLSGEKLEAPRSETGRVVAAAAGETGRGEIHENRKRLGSRYFETCDEVRRAAT